jgi:nitrite reductase/ring-hydroxylating ferredoxin subunit
MFSKKILSVIIITLFIISSIQCDQNGFNNNNPFLPNYNFSFDIDTNLPSYVDLQFTGNSELITFPGAGVGGVVIFNSGSGYRAYDAACPNQVFSSCSLLTLNGIFATCPCDDVNYNLFTGLAEAEVQFPMKPYRVEVNGSIIRVYN